jgi:CheY-like chemotaxis protein
LIAEDNPVNQKLATRVLNKLGYTPDVASNGREALDAFIASHHNMILMDVQMPEMDGLETTQRIRQHNGTQPVIIAMTANAMQGDREQCIKAGMNDYISKPVNLEELMKTIERWAVTVQQKK